MCIHDDAHKKTLLEIHFIYSGNKDIYYRYSNTKPLNEKNNTLTKPNLLHIIYAQFKYAHSLQK